MGGGHQHVRRLLARTDLRGEVEQILVGGHGARQHLIQRRGVEPRIAASKPPDERVAVKHQGSLPSMSDPRERARPSRCRPGDLRRHSAGALSSSARFPVTAFAFAIAWRRHSNAVICEAQWRGTERAL